jgi:TPP-dependent pyruvate/acetoin dehydrogenase alpha subunit
MNEYGRAEISSYWRDRDYLPGVSERLITANMTADATVEQIPCDAGKRVPDKAMTRTGSPTAQPRQRQPDMDWLDSPPTTGG